MTNTALLVMDIQKAITTRVRDTEYLPRLASAVSIARNADIAVMHVVIGSAPATLRPTTATNPSAPCRQARSPTTTRAPVAASRCRPNSHGSAPSASVQPAHGQTLERQSSRAAGAMFASARLGCKPSLSAMTARCRAGSPR
jgi:nicotinamidase-related amidase